MPGHRYGKNTRRAGRDAGISAEGHHGGHSRRRRAQHVYGGSCLFRRRRGAEIVVFQMSDVMEINDSLVRLRVRCQKNDPIGLGQICILPHIQALGAGSPARLMQLWLQRRQRLVNSTDGPLFITLAGKHKGHATSTDSLRKFVAANFGAGAASHSLRKGGAQFYARRGANEDATRQQGGWHTRDVMRQVYTTLSPSEVCAEIVNVAGKVNITEEVHARLQRLGSLDDILVLPENRLLPVLRYIDEVLPVLNTRILLETKAGKYLRVLCRHSSPAVRDRASNSFARLHAQWMANQASKRRKLK